MTEERPWTKHVLAEHYNIGGGAALLVGDPSQVADGLEAWVRDADVDGFNLVCTFGSHSASTDFPGVHDPATIILGHHDAAGS